jgi:hypothetical protein
MVRINNGTAARISPYATDLRRVADGLLRAATTRLGESASKRHSVMALAIRFTTGTATEFPNWRYICVLETLSGISNHVGKPMIPLHSDSVNSLNPVSPSRTKVPVRRWIL